MIPTHEEIQKQLAKAELDLITAKREFPALINLFNSLPGKVFYAYFYPLDAKIIAHVETRAAFAPIRALRTGVWEKQITNDDGHEAARYTAVSDSGIQLNIYVRELPPSCRVIETQQLLPAEAAKPERMVTVRKVVCDKSTKEEVNLGEAQ